MQPRDTMIRTELHPLCHIQMIIIPDPQQKGEIYIGMKEESLICIVVTENLNFVYQRGVTELLFMPKRLCSLNFANLESCKTK